MQMHELEIEISEDGKIKVKVKGVKGAKCEEITRDLEEALGEVEEREYTEEYYEEEQNVNTYQYDRQ